jgi:hypothetical protein
MKSPFRVIPEKRYFYADLAFVELSSMIVKPGITPDPAHDPNCVLDGNGGH